VADDLDDLLAVARQTAAAAATEAMAWRTRMDELLVEEKAAPDDLVSQADRDAERAAIGVLRACRPHDSVVGEESGSYAGDTGVGWVIDPIDGTTNYLYGRPDWAVSVAAVRESDGQILAAAVAEPAIERLTEARLAGGAWSGGERVGCRPADGLERALVEMNLGRPQQRAHAGAVVDALVGRVRDVRRGGSAAAALAQVATGRADAYWGPGLRAWDGAAGMLLVAEAGGVVGDLDGATRAAWPPSDDILAASAGLWEPLRQVLTGAWGEPPRDGGTTCRSPQASSSTTRSSTAAG
jgi:myo-inositol-1(or 4)-monophosphatase